MSFYVDGVLAGSNSAVTSAGIYSGYWRIGGDKGWTSQSWFSGSVDEVAVYPAALTAQQVAQHFKAATVAAASTPTASMTTTTTGLTVNVDGSSSSDTGSTITGYSWDFGDGTTGIGVTASHTYAAGGTYPVKLTVTDALGATNSTSRSVTVVAPAAGAADTFSRTVTGGLGTADTGGTWTTSGGSTNISVGSGVARFSTTAGITLTGLLSNVALPSSDTKATFSVAALPVGGSSFASLVGRKVSTDDYTARVTIGTSGAVTIAVLHGSTILKSATVTGLTYAAGTPLRLRLQVVGSNPTTVQAKVWPAGGSEPAIWQVSTTDATAALQAAGSVGLRTYTGGGVTNGPMVVTFDDFAATSAQ
jgi:PKD repeat protein